MSLKDIRAIIFSAGLGTRLKPLTDNKPKALVEVNGVTLLEHNIKYLKKHGISNIIVNVHHFSSLIIDFLEKNNNFGINIIISDETNELLDTGGGIIKAKDFLCKSDSFIAYNVDIICNMNLNNFYTFHKKNNSFATLAVRERESSRSLLFNKNSQLVGWKNNTSNEIIILDKTEEYIKYGFSGIQFIKSSIFNLNLPEEKFSITKLYLNLCENQKIIGFNHTNDGFWVDAGKPSSIIEAENLLSIKP